MRGLDLHEKFSACVRQGVWPSEGSVSEEVFSIAQKLGVKWMATDEGVLGRSLGVFFARDGNGRLPGRSWRKSSIPSTATRADTTEMHLIFRDHTISDLIGFVYSGMPRGPGGAAPHAKH